MNSKHCHAQVTPGDTPSSYKSFTTFVRGGSGGSDGGGGKKSDKEVDYGDKLHNVTVKYLKETSIHGLKYFGEENRHVLEKIFWLVTIVFAWTMAGYLIYKVMYKWQKAPVLVSFDSRQVAVYEIPFPSLTICNMNKVSEDTQNSFLAVHSSTL